MKQWYAIKSKPRKESSTTVLLRHVGIEVYLPEIKVHKNSHKPAAVEPLFPGYFFGRLDKQLGEIHLTKYTPGVLYVVGYGAEPSPVPDELILSIQRKIAQDGGSATEADFHPGDRVIITSGPLRDVEAVFDRRLSPSGRIRVLVKILHRVCRTEVHVGQLQRPRKAADLT